MQYYLFLEKQDTKFRYFWFLVQKQRTERWLQTDCTLSPLAFTQIHILQQKKHRIMNEVCSFEHVKEQSTTPV